MRKSNVALVASGAVLVLGALVIRLVVYPAATKVPSDLDVLAEMTGTAIVLDQNAMA
ncbi:hypothetical protein AB0L97_36990 [Nocardia sp. NPDC051911]|uniref:hypothetical protein n=1 Tax=Nocardia sp. NPDC051911 TaxID=3154648 RepID=UPI00342E298A